MPPVSTQWIMRKIVVVLGLLGGVVVLAGAGIWVLANPNRHREKIQTLLQDQLSRNVTLGQMSLGLFPLRFQIANSTIAEDSSLGAKPFIQAGNLDVRLELLPLISGNLRVISVELRQPIVELVKGRDGKWNFATIQAKNQPQGDTPSAGSAGSSGGFSLDKLTIVDGQVGYTDLQQNHPRSVYDHIDLALLNFAPGKPFEFELAARIQGGGAQDVRLKGEGGPLAKDDPGATPFHGTLNLNQVEIAGLMKFLDVSAIAQAKGILSGQSDVSSQGGSISTTGKLSLDKAQFNNLDIGYPIRLDYKMAAKVADGAIAIENATLQLGQTPLAISGLLNTMATPPSLDLRLKSGDVAIAEIARLASAFGIAFASGTTVNGRVSADLQAKGAMAKPVMTGSLAGRDLQISGQGIPQPVSVKAINLALSPSAIQSNEFVATSGTTTVMARFAVLQYASSSPSLDLGLRSAAATLPEIQSIARAYGLTGLDQISGLGSLNFDLNAKGPMQSLDATSAIKALNGVINLDFSPLKVAGFDSAHELGRLGGFASSLTEQGATDIVKVVGRILVRNGIAQTDDLRAQLSIGSIAAAGSADLVAETLDLKLSAVFSKAFSDKVGGSRTGSIMNAALSNSAGEIVVPALVTGSFVKPKFAADLKAVAQLQKQKFIPTLDNPAAAITNIIGVLKGKKDDPADPAQPAVKKPSVLKGLMDAFGKKKVDPPKP